MTISLAPELQSFVNGLVRSGKFQSADAAVAQAVLLMKQREEKLAWLRREIQIGIDELERGEEEPWDVEEMKAELLRRIRQKMKTLPWGRQHERPRREETCGRSPGISREIMWTRPCGSTTESTRR